MPAVVSSKLTRDMSGSISIGNEQSHKLRYQVWTDGPMWGPAVIIGAYTATPDPLPTLYQQWVPGGLSTGAYVLSIAYSADDDNHNRWLMDVELGKLPPGKSAADAVQNPLNRPPRYRIEYMEEQIVIEKDREGKPITNSVGDPPDTALEDVDAYPVLVVDKNFATLQEIVDLGNQYHRSVNSDSFYGASARKVRFMPLQASDIQNENGIEFYTATMRFAFNPRTWDREYLNRGWRYRKAAGGPLQLAMDDKTNLPVTSPVKLKLDGTLAADGQETYITRQTLEPKAYGAIGV